MEIGDAHCFNTLSHRPNRARGADGARPRGVHPPLGDAQAWDVIVRGWCFTIDGAEIRGHGGAAFGKEAKAG